MARKKPESVDQTTAIAERPSTDLEPWELEMQEDAKKAVAKVANLGGAKFISIRGGVMSIDDKPVPNNEIAVVIMASVAEKVFYTEKYDPKSTTPAVPACYSYLAGEEADVSAMVPHKDVESPVCETCKDCPKNVFGSADTGKGKACSDRRKLAVIPAGQFSKDGRFEPTEEAYADIECYTLSIPPTALRDWGNYVKNINSAYKRPPHGVITKIKCSSDPDKQVALTFTFVAKVATKEDYYAVKNRIETSESNLMVPYPKKSEKAAAAPAKEGGKKGGKSKY